MTPKSAIAEWLGQPGHQHMLLVVVDEVCVWPSCHRLSCSRLALTPSIAVAPERDFGFLLELLSEPDSTEPSSSKAEYLRLLLEAAEIEAEVDEVMVPAGTDGGRTMAGLSLSLSLLSLSSKSISVSFPFPFPFPLLNGAGILKAAP